MEQVVAPDSSVQVYSDGCYHGQSDKLSDATFTICKSYLATIRHPEADGCRKCALILLLSLAAIVDILLFGVGVAMWPLNLLISILCYTIGACCPETQCQDMVGCCDVTACCVSVSGGWLCLFRIVRGVLCRHARARFHIIKQKIKSCPQQQTNAQK